MSSFSVCGLLKLRANSRNARLNSTANSQDLQSTSILNNDVINNTLVLDSTDHNSNLSDSVTIPKKRGPHTHTEFSKLPLGNHSHPYLGMLLDFAAMEEYVKGYARQEGFYCLKKKDGKVIRWRCVHSGKYNDWRKLPREVTEESQRAQLQAASVSFKSLN